MAKEKTVKSRYPSRYSDSHVTAAQYITEIICERKAALKGSDLPREFWKMKAWSFFFRDQVGAANALLRIYDEKAIIRALKQPGAQKIFSLRAPFLDNIIKLEQQRLNAEKEQLDKAEVKVSRVDVLAQPRKPKPVKTAINVLKEL